MSKLSRLTGLLLLGSLSACTPQPVQLMLSPTTAGLDGSAAWVRSLRLHRQQLSVRDQHGQTHRFPLPAIWGYRTPDDRQYRFVSGDTYEVMQAGPVWIYQTQEWIGDAAWETLYFSLESNSAVFLLDKRTCLALFQPDGCMHERLTYMKTRQLINVDRAGTYGLNAVYRLCHQPGISRPGVSLPSD